MAKTFRPTRCFGAPQSLAASSSYAERLRAADRAVDCPNAPTFGQTASGLDWPPRDPARPAQGVGQTDPIVGHYQPGIANARLGVHADRGVPGLFSETLDDGRRNPAGVGLDVSLSRRRPQGLRLSPAEPAHTRLRANDRRRQKQRHGDAALPQHLENPGNPAVFATRQRRRFLWRLQSPAHLRPVRPAVLVPGPRTDLLDHRRTRTQWRGRRIERPVGTCLLGETPIWARFTREPKHLYKFIAR